MNPNEYPLSYGQKALWFVQQLEPTNIAHNVVHALQLGGETDITALQKAWQGLVDRHAVLRTTFHDHGGDPYQRVHMHRYVCFSTVDASAWDQAYLKKILAEETFKPFELSTGPLLRVIVYTRAEHNPIMLVAFHHIITDLWSLAIMLGELTQLYQSHAKGLPATLRPLKVEYRDHVETQIEMMNGETGRLLWDYWRRRLPGPHPPLKLPVRSHRPAKIRDHGEALQHILSGHLVESLENLARAENTSLFTVVLAAFQTLLHRYSGQIQFTMGTTKAGRSHKTARVSGYFVNPIVIKADFRGDPTFLEFLHRSHLELQGDFSHDAFPYPLLVERLAPARQNGRSQLIQVMFAWQKTASAVDKSQMAAITLGAEGRQMDVGGLVTGPVFIKDRATPFDWGLWVAEASTEGGKELHLTLEYKIDLFERVVIRGVLSHIETLFEAIGRNPAVRVSTLPLLSNTESKTIANRMLPAAAPFKDTPPVGTLISHQALRTPGAVALIDKGRSLTYAQLNLQANRLANRLLRMGIAPEQCVAVGLTRSIPAIVAFLAVLKSGGIYLPLDMRSPPDRLKFMLKNSEARVLITESRIVDKFLAHPQRTVICDSLSESIDGEEGCDPDVEIIPESAAYTIYTSGTTGPPKAVIVSHLEFSRHCRTMAMHYDLSPEDRVLQFAALSFDASLEQIAPTLITGAALVLADPEDLDVKKFWADVRTNRVSIVNLPPAYFQQVVEVWAAEQRNSPGRLRLIIIGGDALRYEMVRPLTAMPRSKLRLLNAYGPTEATITAATHEIPIDTHSDTGHGSIPVGRVLPDRVALVLDRYGQMAPVGVPGELYLGGSCLARGYLGLPDKTAEVFIPNDYAAVPGERLYRTGDAAVIRGDGSLEILGRLDHQVKIRGFRMELGEVEGALEEHPGLRQAVVVARDDAAGSRELIAYVVPRVPNAPGPNELKAFLRDRLPDYMVPLKYVSLQELPLSAGGKIDRFALPVPETDFPPSGNGFIPPRTSTEALLCRIWEEVLEVAPIGIYDNFFELGGHSLKATRLVSRIREAFYVELPVSCIFDEPSVEALSKCVEGLLIEAAGDDELNRLISELDA